MKNLLAAAILALVCGGSVQAKSVQPMGTLNVTVLDENGALVPSAPVYIYGDKKTHFIGGKNIPGTATLDMPAGTYRISAAIIRKTGDYTDRFASPEAFVEVVAGDNSVVTLHLRSLDDPLAKLGVADLSRVGLEGRSIQSF